MVFGWKFWFLQLRYMFPLKSWEMDMVFLLLKESDIYSLHDLWQRDVWWLWFCKIFLKYILVSWIFRAFHLVWLQFELFKCFLLNGAQVHISPLTIDITDQLLISKYVWELNLFLEAMWSLPICSYIPHPRKYEGNVFVALSFSLCNYACFWVMFITIYITIFCGVSR